MSDVAAGRRRLGAALGRRGARAGPD
jgi:hypothetical protein